MSADRNAAEAEIRRAFDATDYQRAATLTIEHYGEEVLGYLASRLRDPDAASEVFAAFSEVFWRTLSQFAWRCSARTWAYKLAVQSANQYLRGKLRRRHASLPPDSQLSDAVERMRSTTAPYLRTTVKDRFQALRERLSDEDQQIVVLRIDRGLSWLELAEVMLCNDTAATEAQLKTEAARLRKRFHHAKERLREMARSEGLLES